MVTSLLLLLLILRPCLTIRKSIYLLHGALPLPPHPKRSTASEQRNTTSLKCLCIWRPPSTAAGNRSCLIPPAISVHRQARVVYKKRGLLEVGSASSSGLNLARRAPNVSPPVYWFPSAAITKDHKLGGLKQQKLFSHSFGGRKCEIKVLAGWSFWGSEGKPFPCLSPSFWGPPAILGL